MFAILQWAFGCESDDAYFFSPFQVQKSSPKEYERLLFNYSLKNQLRFRGNLGEFELYLDLK